MKQKKIRKRLGKAIREQQICRVVLDFAPDREFRFLPVNSSEQLICMIREGDTRSYGYAVFCLEDIKKVVVEDEAVKLRGKDTKQGMKIDLADWPAVFRSLGMRGKAVIVESARAKEKENEPEKEPEKEAEKEAKKEEPAAKESVFAIGKIEKVGHRQVVIAYYGPDPAWEDKKWKISYDSITHVNTASSYTEVMSQYVPEGEAEVEPLSAETQGEKPQEAKIGSKTQPIGPEHLAGRDIEAEWEPLPAGATAPGELAADHSSSIGRLLDSLESLDLSGDGADKIV